MRAGRRLAYLHPWRWMANLYTEAQLELIYLAATRLFDPEAPLNLRHDLEEANRQAVEERVDSTRKLIKRNLSRATRDYLADVFARLWSRDERPNLAAWHRHAEVTSIHAALIACGDVAMVVRALREDALGATSTLKRSDKLRELVHYVLGDAYHQIRVRCGLAVQAPPQKG